MDMVKHLLVFVYVLATFATVDGASNNTDHYTEPEEISDSIPVAITILVILVILVLIFIIILLIICIKLCTRGSRKKDIEDQTVLTTYRNDTTEPERERTPERRQDPVGRHTPPSSRHESPLPHRRSETPPRAETPHRAETPQRAETPRLVYVSPEAKNNRLPPISKPGHVCQCEECEDLRKDPHRTTHSHR